MPSNAIHQPMSQLKMKNNQTVRGVLGCIGPILPAPSKRFLTAERKKEKERKEEVPANSAVKSPFIQTDSTVWLAAYHPRGRTARRGRRGCRGRGDRAGPGVCPDDALAGWLPHLSGRCPEPAADRGDWRDSLPSGFR